MRKLLTIPRSKPRARHDATGRGCEPLEPRAMLAVDLLTGIANQSLLASASGPVKLDLADHFDETTITGSVVEFRTGSPGGVFHAEIFDKPGPERARSTPQTAAAFLERVAAGLYDGTFAHDLVAGVTLQSGGFTRPNLPADQPGSDPQPIPSGDPVANEPGNPNLPGTLAMAKIDSQSTAGSGRWFFNLGDNRGIFDTAQGGHTVFGRVLGQGMTVVNAMATAPTYDASSYYGDQSFVNLPLQNLATDSIVRPENFLSFTDLNVVGELTYTVTSSNPAIVAATLEGSSLTLAPGTTSGVATIVVRATSLIDPSQSRATGFSVTVNAAENDFNGDGISDEVFRNEQTGSWVAIFRKADGSKTGELALGGDLAWTIQATGDFDGDGVTDIVWRYQPAGPTEGRAQIHLRNAAGVVSVNEIGGNAFWQVEATGDFDGDGDDDIMWRNNVSGKILGWEMQGGRQSGPGVWMGGNIHWRLVATSSIYDANADGRTDLIFVHTSGRHILWHMNGLAYQHHELGTPVPGVFVAGTGDFDGDGRSDLLWRNEQTGAITMWLVYGTGATPRNGGIAPVGGNLNWSAVGTADYDGDGRSDIIWHNPPGGGVLPSPFLAWSLQGSVPTDTRWVTDLPGTPSDYTPLRRPGRTSG